MRGAVCPGPIVEAKQLLKGMRTGEVLKLVSDCPGVRDDIVGWAQSTGTELVTEAQRADVQGQAVRAFTALKLRGCARIDFRMTDAGEMYCLEANTLPGMTATSLLPNSAKAAGISFEELVERDTCISDDSPRQLLCMRDLRFRFLTDRPLIERAQELTARGGRTWAHAGQSR